jgi:iron complex transport system substrate-binding protein
MMRREALGATLALAGSPLLAAPSTSPVAQAWPRELSDAMNRRVRLAQAPQRLVVVFPSNVELVFALGLADRVVAIGGRVRYPEAALSKPSIGGALGYSPEVVAAQRPDLIVVTPSHQSALGLIEPFSRLGVAVLVLAHPDLPSVLRNIDLLGRACGVEPAAQGLRAQFQQGLEQVKTRWAGRTQPSVYLETAAAARGAFQTIGQGHYANDALAWAGGRNVFADLEGSQQVSAEAIALRDPDVIISLQQSPKEASLIGERPGWQRLRAVRQGRVHVLARGHKLIPGPRQLEAVQAYARALHPEVFA